MACGILWVPNQTVVMLQVPAVITSRPPVGTWTIESQRRWASRWCWPLHLEMVIKDVMMDLPRAGDLFHQFSSLWSCKLLEIFLSSDGILWRTTFTFGISQNIASNHGDICGGDVGVREPGRSVQVNPAKYGYVWLTSQTERPRFEYVLIRVNFFRIAKRLGSDSTGRQIPPEHGNLPTTPQQETKRSLKFSDVVEDFVNALLTERSSTWA